MPRSGSVWPASWGSSSHSLPQRPLDEEEHAERPRDVAAIGRGIHGIHEYAGRAPHVLGVLIGTSGAGLEPGPYDPAYARVAQLVEAATLKVAARKSVRVRVPPRAFSTRASSQSSHATRSGARLPCGRRNLQGLARVLRARAPSSRVEASALKHVTADGLRGPTPLLRIQSDERLVALTRRGNQAAYEALVGRYQSRLLAFCRHMLGSREDAEDVLQEVFAAAFNAMIADERALNVRPWLYRIARNRSLNHLRRVQAIGVDSMDVHLSENGASAADKVHRREEFRLLVEDVQGLPETQRTALLLREIDALSYDQIAEAMETTIPSVKSLLVRARVSLAESAEARHLTCDEVRDELGEVAEGLHRMTAPVRRHLRQCDRCAAFRKQLRQTNRALAAVFPVGPLLLLKKLVLANLGTTASAGGSAAAAGAGAGAAGRGRGQRAVGRRRGGRLEGRRRAGRRRDRHRRRGRGRPRRPAPPAGPPRRRRRRRHGARLAAGGRLPAAARRGARSRTRAPHRAADKPPGQGARTRASATPPRPSPSTPRRARQAGARRRAPAGLGDDDAPGQTPRRVVTSGGPDQQASPPPAARAGRRPPIRWPTTPPPAPPVDRAARRQRPTPAPPPADEPARRGADAPPAATAARRRRPTRRPSRTPRPTRRGRPAPPRARARAAAPCRRPCRCRGPGTPSARGRSAWAGSSRRAMTRRPTSSSRA